MINNKLFQDPRIINSVTETVANVIFKYKTKICYTKVSSFYRSCSMNGYYYPNMLSNIRDDIIRKMDMSDDIGRILQGHTSTEKEYFVDCVLRRVTNEKVNKIYEYYLVKKYPDVYEIVKYVLFGDVIKPQPRFSPKLLVPNQRTVEGLSLKSLILGDPPSTQTNITSVNNAISSLVNQTVINNTQSCQTTYTGGQNITLACNPSPATLAANAAAQAACVSEVLAFCGNTANATNIACTTLPATQCNTPACSFTDLTQNQAVTWSGNCAITQAQQQAIQSQVTNAMQNQVSNTSDALGTALNTLTSGLAGGTTNTNTNITNNLSNSVTNALTQTNLQQLINNFSNQQNISITGTGGLSASGISQTSALNLTSSMLQNNSDYMNALSTLSNTEGATSTTTSTFQLFDTIANDVTSIISSITEGYVLISVAVICACIICCVAVAWWSNSNPEATSQLIGQAGQFGSQFGRPGAGSMQRVAPPMRYNPGAPMGSYGR